MKKIVLTREEQEIEDNIENFVPLSPENKRRSDAAMEKARKEAHISLRISEEQLRGIKEKAKEEGLPYQTLIGSVLRKYVTHQLVDAKMIKKIVAAMK